MSSSLDRPVTEEGMLIYSPEMSYVDMAEEADLFPPRVVNDILSRAKYPAYWISAYAKNRENDSGAKVARLRKIKSRRQDVSVDPKSRGKKGQYAEFERGSGAVSTAWRIRCSKVPRIPKPEFFSRSSFLRWVHGEASFVMEGISDPKSFPSGNLACQALYLGRPDRVRANLLLSQAAVFRDRYDAKSMTKTVMLLSDFIPTTLRSLMVQGKEYVCVTPYLESLLAKDKPLLSRAKSWLSGSDQFNGEHIDHVKLQMVLSAKFPSIVFGSLPPVSEPVEYKGVDPKPHYLETAKHILPESVGRVVALVSQPRLPLYRPFDLVLERPHFLPFDLYEVVFRKHKPSGRSRLVGRLEGGAPSRPLASVIVEDTLSDLLSQHARVATQLTAFLSSLFLCETWSQRAAVILQFVSGNDYLWAKCKALFHDKIVSELQALPAFVESAFESMKDWFGAAWELIVSSSLAMAARSLFGDIAETFYKPFGDFAAQLRLAMLREGAKSVALSIIEAISMGLERIRLCWQQRSFAPLWGPKWDPVSWVKYARTFMIHESLLCVSASSKPRDFLELRALRESGELPLWWTVGVIPSEYISRLEEHHCVGRDLLKYFSRMPEVKRNLSITLADLERKISDLKIASYCSHERVTPFLIVFHGHVGSGKTNLEAMTRRAVAARNGFCMTPEGMHTWEKNVNFQSGLDSKKWSVTFDDPDHGVAPPTAGFPTHIEAICKLVNNCAYQVEEAAVDAKGKIFASPLLVNYVTNFPDCKVGKNTSEPNAFWRRVDMYVEVLPRPEFSKQGTKVLDPDRASHSDTHDMFILRVSYFDPSKLSESNREIIPLTDPITMTYPEFMRVMLKRFDAKMERERNHLISRADFSLICPECALPRTKSCGCGVTGDFDTVRREILHLEEMLPGLIGYEGGAPSKLAPIFEEEEVDDYAPLFSDLEERTRWRKCRGPCWRARNFVLDHVKQMALAVADDTVQVFAMRAGAIAALGATIAAIYYFKKSYLQGREGNGTGLVPASWKRAEQNWTPGVPPPGSGVTYTKEELVAVLSSSHVTVEGPRFALHGFAIGHNCIVTPTHVLYRKGGGHLNPFKVDESQIDESTVLYVTVNGTIFKTVVSKLCFSLVSSHPQMCVIRIPGLGGTSILGGKIWSFVDTSVSQFDEVELWSGEKERSTLKNWMKMNGPYREIYCEFSTRTEAGHCGSAYVGRFGDSWRVVGFHYMAMDHITSGTVSSIGAVVSGNDLRAAALNACAVLQGVETIPQMFTLSADYALSHYPIKSELLAAVEHHGARVFPLGTLSPPLAGSTPKTRVQFSMIADDFRDDEEEWCGQKGYWRLPEFRGKMIDDKWCSSYTESFEVQNSSCPDEYTMWLALADYLSGMDQLDTSGYSVLSEEQIFTGVPGSVIGPIDLKTSVGPPYNRKKVNFMTVSRDEGSFMNEDIWVVFDEIEETLSRGEIPRAFGLCTQKDEALKPDKRPRIFICLPFPYNMCLKKYFAPIVCFMRAHWSFFESAVGVDMTSSSCNQIVHKLKNCNPGLDKVDDGDTPKMDKSFQGKSYDFIARVAYAIAFVLGVDPWKAYLLVLGLKHCAYSMKNDLFSVFWNPSGQYITVEVNGWDLSIEERYVFYRTHPPKISREEIEAYARTFFENPMAISFADRLTFRDRNALVTYGDDKVATRRDPLTSIYQKIWKEELGKEMTDGAKQSVITPLPLEEISFLRRTLSFNPEFGFYTAALSLKTMARMVIIKKESTLSRPDHAAVAMTEFMREAVYHGRAFYDRYLEKCRRVAEKHGISENGYLRLVPYDYYAEKVVEGSFRTWEERVLIEKFVDLK